MNETDQKRDYAEVGFGVFGFCTLLVAILYLFSQFMFPSKTHNWHGFAMVLCIVGLVAKQIQIHMLVRRL